MAQPRTIDEALDAIVKDHAAVYNPDRLNVGSIRRGDVLYAYSYGPHWIMGAYSEAAECWLVRPFEDRYSVTTTRHTTLFRMRVGRVPYMVVDGAVLQAAFKRYDPLLPAEERDVLRKVLARERFTATLRRRGVHGGLSDSGVYSVSCWAGPIMAVWLEELGEWWGRRGTADTLLAKLPIAKWVDGVTLRKLRDTGYRAMVTWRLGR